MSCFLTRNPGKKELLDVCYEIKHAAQAVRCPFARPYPFLGYKILSASTIGGAEMAVNDIEKVWGND